mmetsp:Transcript_32897/g.70801  ORF Transcript_32897/g.70801 Transcript_32897/m.70801 type:complete len:281 (+) Transcript_32897:305-1147(+)
MSASRAAAATEVRFFVLPASRCRWSLLLTFATLSSCCRWASAFSASDPDDGAEGAFCLSIDGQRAPSEQCSEALGKPSRREHAMLQLKQNADVTILTDSDNAASAASACTPDGEQAFVHPHYHACCSGLRLHLASGKCMGNFVQKKATACTGADEDPYISGSFVACCEGLEKKVSDWTTYKNKRFFKGYWYYLCIDNSDSTSSSTSSSTSATTATTTTTPRRAARRLQQSQPAPPPAFQRTGRPLRKMLQDNPQQLPRRKVGRRHPLESLQRRCTASAPT